ncbi:glutathione S-transferase 1-like [Liolophura sinensis]|uniref:glutathione S-transferase 1-like n=1 Tax=Liolophura sinensis TaxID=3198878 RepID=UPI0031591307
MPKYKLTYFNFKAKGEIIRLLFKVAGVPFEDFRIEVGADLKPPEDWLKLKPKMPFGQIPLLEVDGKELVQTIAIKMYLAREFGMAGESSFDQAKALMWLEAGDDLYNQMSAWVKEQNPDKKEELKTNLKTVTLKFFLEYLQKTLSANKSGYTIGDKLTVADLLAFQLRDWLSIVGEDMTAVYDSYSDVQKLYAKIGAIPAIADWLKKRPKTAL